MAHVIIKYLGDTIIEGNFEDMDVVTDMATQAIKARHPEVDEDNLGITSVVMDLAPGTPEVVEEAAEQQVEG